MNPSRSRLIPFLLLLATMILGRSGSVLAQDAIGGRAPNTQMPAQTREIDSLSRTVSEFGQISWSIDAMGIIGSVGTIQVEKPANATVRKAYLMSATTGFKNHRLQTGNVKLEGNDIVWEQEIQTSITSYNYWGDVTAVIKKKVDEAPSGIINLAIAEANSDLIDGEILVVIFDDPNESTDNTILLHFGAQNVNGDSFSIDLGAPIDKSDPNFTLDYSLGISYGCLGSSNCGGVQYSRVDVNGKRLTTSAGGQDDGQLYNGSLITVGGIGDKTDNPTEPFALPTGARSDDELYDLRSFVDNGDTAIKIDTYNPSDDDNIFFAAVLLGSTRSIGTIDVDISLYNNPTLPADRESYENIIRYFADGVYESSNGAHKLGTVTFRTLYSEGRKADVLWIDKCHPSANGSGIVLDGAHVNMCDIFEKGGKFGLDYDYLDGNGHQRMGGYALAHEWGHYYYGLYDEYAEASDHPELIFFPRADDLPVKNSIMHSQWKAHGLLGDNFDWLNFSIDKNDTGKNAQHRAYGASGWTTLARPISSDPRDGDREALNRRVHYPELAAVRPNENQDSPHELPGEARSALRIVWQSALLITDARNEPVDLPFIVQLASVGGTNISYPNPILLQAFVGKEWYVTGVEVKAIVKLPDGTTKPVTFTDDGTAPDAVSEDGLYSAILGYEENGLYEFSVQFNGDPLGSLYVTKAFLPSIGEDGPVPFPASFPLDESFNLSDTLQVSVSNVAADDFGNTPGSAEPITADNEPIPGKIDYANDKDVFSFDTPGDGTTTFVRLTNLAFGMDPYLRIYGSDGSTILAQQGLNSNESPYLFIPLATLPPGTTVFAEVSNANAAAGGLYEFSAGPQLASDKSETTRIFLPTILGGAGQSTIATSTPTPIPSATPTGTTPPTLTATASPTPSSTPTATPTATATASPTPSSTPTSSPTTTLTPTPTVTSTTTPTPTATVTAPALNNGDFEQGTDGSWSEYSSHGYGLIFYQDNLPIFPHGGVWSGWLGGDDNEISYLEQIVTVPPAAPYLGYWQWSASSDACGFDFGGVVIDGSTIVDVYDLCEGTNTDDWSPYMVDLSSYAGQTIALQIRVETDSSFNSNLFVDDVAFQSSTAVNSPPPASRAVSEQLHQAHAIKATMASTPTSDRPADRLFPVRRVRGELVPAKGYRR